MYGYKTNGVYTTDDFVQNGDKYVLKDGVIYQKGSVKTQYKPGDIKYINTITQKNKKSRAYFGNQRNVCPAMQMSYRVAKMRKTVESI